MEILSRRGKQRGCADNPTALGEPGLQPPASHCVFQHNNDNTKSIQYTYVACVTLIDLTDGYCKKKAPGPTALAV